MNGLRTVPVYPVYPNPSVPIWWPTYKRYNMAKKP